MSAAKEWRASGTIRISVTSSGVKKVFLTPDSDHLAKDGDAKFAIFFPVGTGDLKSKEIDAKGTGAELHLKTGMFSLYRIALSAALEGVKVSVLIDVSDEVVEVSIPADDSS